MKNMRGLTQVWGSLSGESERTLSFCRWIFADGSLFGFRHNKKIVISFYSGSANGIQNPRFAKWINSRAFCTMKLIAVAVLSLLGLSLGKDVSYDFRLDTEIDSALSPDCMNVKEVRRSLFLANGMFPGPPIEVNEGDNVTVRIHNGNEASSVSIHFHGIHQMGTPYSDGTSFVTQCALGPLQTQEYNFIAYPSGTHYWHEHASYQMVDGITGPLIVRPKDPDPFTYDEERVSYKRQRLHTEVRLRFRSNNCCCTLD
jgi:Multicopper oxidase